MYSSHATNMFYFAFHQVLIKRGGLGHREINKKSQREEAQIEKRLEEKKMERKML